MKQLAREALLVTQDLGRVIFIGAIARYFHTNVYRESKDLDFVVEKPVSKKALNDKGYNQFERNGKLEWFSPRGIKLDIYSRDVSGIPVRKIIDTAIEFPAGRSKERIRVMSLESLIVAKHRAQRAGDVEDLHIIANTKSRDIRWDLLRTFTKSKHEYDSIRTTIVYLSRA